MQTQKIDFSHTVPLSTSAQATHYGYLAFRDIDLRSPFGWEYRVQPFNSPFLNVLPKRTLIPFTNISTLPDVDWNNELAEHPSNAWIKNPVAAISRNAYECLDEIASAYEEWGFVKLPLTGMDYDTAFHIFQTIQPFAYNIRDLVDQLSFYALDRIASDAPIIAEYEGETITLEPLPASLKEIAETVRVKMLQSAEIALDRAELIVEKTTQSMTQFFATGNGKRQSDPLDKAIFAELGRDIPKLIEGAKKDGATETTAIGQLADILKNFAPQKQTATADTAVTASDLAKELEAVRAMKAELDATLKAVKAASATATPTATDSSQTVSIGQQVIVGGQPATVASKHFGRIKVTFADGSSQTVDKDEIE